MLKNVDLNQDYDWYDEQVNQYLHYDHLTGTISVVNKDEANQTSSSSTTTNNTTNQKTNRKNFTNFFSIFPRDNNLNLRYEEPIPLRVIQDDGIEVTPDISFKTTDLAGSYKIFQNFSGFHDSFKISIMINVDDMASFYYNRPFSDSGDDYTWDLFESQLVNSMGAKEDNGKNKSVPQFYDVPVYVALNYWIKKGVPLYIYTNAVGIHKKHLYLITENKKRLQEYDDGWMKWDLTFVRYNEIKKLTFQKSTKIMKNAIKNSKLSKQALARKKARTALAKCNYKKIVYSKKEKKVDCVKKMQQVLYLQKFLSKKQVDGWYGKKTKEAVKKYQKKWSKTYGLKVTGNINKHTFQVMIGKGKKVNKKTTSKTSKSNVTAVNVSSAALKEKTSKNMFTGRTKVLVKNVNNVNISNPNMLNTKTPSKVQKVNTTVLYDKKTGKKITKKGKAKTVTTKSSKKVTAKTSNKKTSNKKTNKK